jgi:cytochrome c biogenesis protein CcmG, thiol:disulfide interchange protein DsbE
VRPLAAKWRKGWGYLLMSDVARRAVLGGGAAALAAWPAAAAPKIGKPAPDFTITTFAKEKIAFSQLTGKVILINFWATWCAPCRVELPVLDAYVRRAKSDDLKVYAITTEGSVPAAKLKPLEKLVGFPLGSKISGRGYAPIKGAVPTNFIIDKGGVLRYAKSGAFDTKMLDDLVAPLLREPAPAAANVPQPA